jgi:lysophospholipase L1-like esterase
MTTESRPPRHSWFHSHPALTLASTALFGLLLLAVVAEIGARVVLRQWGPTVGGERTTYARYDELLGWAQRPGFQERFTRREFSVEVRINTQGLRDREYPLERTGKKRVVVLGDSFGWGYGVELAERFDELLERDHPDWEIINASVSGYGTDQQLLYLRDRGLAYRPDVVMLLLYQNDFTNNRASAQYYTNKPYFVMSGADLELRNAPVPPPSLSQRAARWLGGTYLWGRVVQAAIGVADQLSRARSGAAAASDHQLTLRRVEEVAKTSAAGGARFLLVSVPMDAQRRELLAGRASERGIPYLPLDPAFAQGAEGLVFPENLHWTAAGHRVAAEAIERLLVETLGAAPAARNGGA